MPLSNTINRIIHSSATAAKRPGPRTLCVLALLLMGCLALAQSLSKEYIRLGGRVIAIESPVASGSGTVTVNDGNGQSAQINTPFAIRLKVIVKNAQGNPVDPDTSVTFTALGSGASITFASTGTATATVTTPDASGVATSPAFTANLKAGPVTVTATSGTATSATFTLTNNPGPAATITATSGTPQSAPINQPFPSPLVATVTDQGGNPVPGAPVTFAAPLSGPSGTFAGSSTINTNTSGVATAPAFTANSVQGGPYNVTATSGTATRDNFVLTNTPASGSISATTAPQSAQILTQFSNQLVALVKNPAGTPVGAGIVVTFTAPGGPASGTFPGPATTVTAATNSSGYATSPVFTANSKVGAYTVTASAPGTSPATFNMTNTAGPAVSIAPTQGGGQAAQINTPFLLPLKATVFDQGQNPVPGQWVTFAAPGSGPSATFSYSPTVMTDSSGVATSPALRANGIASQGGAYFVTASVAGVQSATFALTNGAAASGSIILNSDQSAIVGTPFSFPLQATVTDANGNPVVGSTSVTFTAPQYVSGAPTPTAFFSGTSTSATVGTTFYAGIPNVAVTGITAGTVAGTYKVTVSAPAVSASATYTLTNIAGATPLSISRSSGSGQSASTGAAFGSRLEALVQDFYHNPMPGATVTFTPPTSGASVIFVGTNSPTPVTATTDLTGLAVSPYFNANTIAGDFTVTATTGSASPASFALKNTQGAVAAPTFTLASGSYLSTQSVSITAPSGSIYYTLDGSIPNSTTSNLYNNVAIPITSTTKLRAIAHVGATDSPVTSAYYAIVVSPSSGYAYSRRINLTPPSDLPSFPVLFSFTDQSLTSAAGKVKSSKGYDIVFSTDPTGAGTPLPHEIQQYDATAGTFSAWVQVPALAHTGTTIYMFYGNSSFSTSQENPPAVWDTNYQGVWHLGNDTTLPATDSTLNFNTGTPTSVSPSTGGAGTAGAFDGSTSRIQIPDSPSLDSPNGSNAITMSAWVNVTQFPNNTNTLSGIFEKGASNDSTNNDPYFLRVSASSTLEAGSWTGVDNANHQASWSFTSTDWKIGDWHYVVGSYDGTAWHVYFDGVPKASNTDSGPKLNSFEAVIGASHIYTGIQRFFNGKIGEVRLSNIARPQSWIAAEYANQRTPASFYTVLAETPLSGAANFTVTANPTSVAPGGSLSVSWTAPASRTAKDWIALYPVNGCASCYVWGRYTQGVASLTWTDLTAPTTLGQYEFRYLLNDGFTVAATSGVITVGSLTAPAITPMTLQDGTIGAVYPPTTFAAVGGTGPYTWSAGTGLPAGMSLSAAGVLSGTPATTCTCVFNVTVRDQANQPAVAQFTLKINGLAFTVTANPASVAPGGSLSVSWTAPASRTAKDWIALYQVGGCASCYVWGRYTSGSASNTWTDLTAPATAGQYEFRYLLNDGFTVAATSGVITVGSLTAPAITPMTLQDGTIGAVYPPTTFAAVGGTGPYTWSAGTGLPAGMSLSAAGVLSGTPAASCNCVFNVTVRDQANQPAVAQFTLKINDVGFTVTANTPSAAPGGQLSVSWTAPASRTAKDWIALYPVNGCASCYVWGRYTQGVASNTWTDVTAPTTPGQYEFRYLLNDGFAVAATSGPVRVQ